MRFPGIKSQKPKREQRMHNRFVLDQNYNVRLLCNIQEPYDVIEQWRNSILVEIEADSTPDQYIIVTGAEGYTETFNVSPGNVNVFTLSTLLWNYGDITTVEFYKDDSLLINNTLYITFPDIVEGSGAISSDFQIDGVIYLGQNYTMAGSYYSDPETIKEIEQKVEQAEEDITDLKTDKQDTLIAGTGININETTISVTNPITLSTEDLVPGVSSLPSGHIYFVYE